MQNALVWFRNDLRIHDHEPLSKAVNTSNKVLGIYCFDPRDYVLLPAGFPKTGSLRAKFIIACVAALKNKLQELLSSNNLVVRRGGKVVVWKGPKLSGPDYYILSKSLEEKGYTEVRQRETGDRGDEDITMKYKWKK
jgi:deoxyribodipyrimidine photo-lyase